MKKGIILAAAIILVLFVVSGCSKENVVKEETSNTNTSANTSIDVGENNPIVTITMESGDVIDVELYPEIAPNTVNNFVSLIDQNFYDGLVFHRVIPKFMIQGGDPEGNGTGGPGYGIKGEFASNDFENPLVHERGIISMARSRDMDSAGSQFFIMVADAPHLDGEYAAFGKVISGMDVVDAIVSVDKGAGDRPVDPQTIKTVVVDKKGVEYKEPVTN